MMALLERSVRDAVVQHKVLIPRPACMHACMLHPQTCSCGMALHSHLQLKEGGLVVRPDSLTHSMCCFVVVCFTRHLQHEAVPVSKSMHGLNPISKECV